MPGLPAVGRVAGGVRGRQTGFLCNATVLGLSLIHILGEDPSLAEGYRRAHTAYLADRALLGVPEEIDGISAGGMPDRVKCLHVLAAHALACLLYTSRCV